MLNLTGPCVCGGSPERPNDDCERCELVGLVGELLREVYGRRSISYPWARSDIEIAERYGLPVEAVRRIVGQRG
jgi:hypothetical protein